VKYKILEGTTWTPGGEFIKIDPEICTGCGDCVRVCPGGVIKIVDGKAKAEKYENCCECASCWFVCTIGAIKFTWPKGGTGRKYRWG